MESEPKTKTANPSKYPPVDPNKLPYPFAGVDEAGRGCLAGPVVAAAVILPKGWSHPELTDSKLLTPEKREELRIVILAHAVAWAVAESDVQTISTKNILQATFDAMWKAIHQLKLKPELLAIDGNRFRKGEIPHTLYVKGDSRLQAISAASILAKTHRDALMTELHSVEPLYEWDINKGYPTPRHRALLEKYGPSEHHRRGFKTVDASLGLFGPGPR
jgi:ribonuclease HII